MGIVSVIGLILTGLKYIPEVIQIVKEILSLIHGVHQTNPALADSYILRLRDAVKAARLGDTKPLQDLATDLGAAP